MTSGLNGIDHIHINVGNLCTVIPKSVWEPPHDLGTIDELMTVDYVITSEGNDVKGWEAFKAWVKELQNHLLEGAYGESGSLCQSS